MGAPSASGSALSLGLCIRGTSDDQWLNWILHISYGLAAGSLTYPIQVGDDVGLPLAYSNWTGLRVRRLSSRHLYGARSICAQLKVFLAVLTTIYGIVALHCWSLSACHSIFDSRQPEVSFNQCKTSLNTILFRQLESRRSVPSHFGCICLWRIMRVGWWVRTSS